MKTIIATPDDEPEPERKKSNDENNDGQDLESRAAQESFPSASELNLSLGYSSSVHHGYQPPGDWSQWKHVRQELERAVKEYGKIPTKLQLVRDGKFALIKAIDLYHGGWKSAKQKYDTEK